VISKYFPKLERGNSLSKQGEKRAKEKKIDQQREGFCIRRTGGGEEEGQKKVRRDLLLQGEREGKVSNGTLFLPLKNRGRGKLKEEGE